MAVGVYDWLVGWLVEQGLTSHSTQFRSFRFDDWCVCEQAAKRWCTVNKVLRTIICIYVAACVSQITRFFDTIFEYVSL